MRKIKIFMIFLSFLMMISLNIPAKALDREVASSYIDYSSQLLSNDELTRLANSGILINDKLTQVSVDTIIEDDITIKQVNIKKAVSSEKLSNGNTIISYAGAYEFYYSNNKTGYLVVASVTNYMWWTEQEWVDGKRFKITKFGQKLNSFESSFGYVTNLYSVCGQSGLSFTAAGVSTYFTSATSEINVPNPGFNQATRATGFLYFFKGNSGFQTSGVDTTMTFQNSLDGRVWAQVLHNKLY